MSATPLFTRRIEPIPAIPRRRYFASDFPLRRDREGKPLCRWCYAPVLKPRRAWCSEDCIREYQNLSGALDVLIFNRDDGVCQLCGWNLRKLYQVRPHLERLVENGSWPLDWWSELTTALNGKTNQPLHEIDHILPLSLGGFTHPDNLRTLCVPCHRAETKKLAQGLLGKAMI